MSWYRLHAALDGTLLQLQPPTGPGADLGPPDGTAVTLPLDGESNAALLDRVVAEWTGTWRVTVTAGVPTLTRNGVAVPIAGASQATKDRAALDAVRSKIESGAAFTDAQRDAALRWILRKLLG